MIAKIVFEQKKQEKSFLPKKQPWFKRTWKLWIMYCDGWIDCEKECFLIN